MESKFATYKSKFNGAVKKCWFALNVLKAEE